VDHYQFIVVNFSLYDEKWVGSNRWREMLDYLRLWASVVTVSHDVANPPPAGIDACCVPHALRAKNGTRGFWEEPTSRGLSGSLRQLLKNFLCIPDAQIYWSHRAVRSALSRVKQGYRSILITSSPVHSLHLAAARMVPRGAKNIKWIMDLRDPWTTAPAAIWRHRWPPILHQWERRMEARCHNAADVTTVVSKTMGRDILAEFGSSATVVYNGYSHTVQAPDALVSGSKPVTIRYLGKIIPGLRDPSLLFRAARRRGVSVRELKFRFWCSNSEWVKRIAEQEGVLDLVEFNDAITRKAALETEASPGVNLVLNGTDAMFDYILTSKVFELIGIGRPVAAITGESSELRGVLEQCGCNGIVFNDASAGEVLDRIVSGQLNGVEDARRNFHRETAARAVMALADDLYFRSCAGFNRREH